MWVSTKEFYHRSYQHWRKRILGVPKWLKSKKIIARSILTTCLISLSQIRKKKMINTILWKIIRDTGRTRKSLSTTNSKENYQSKAHTNFKSRRQKWEVAWLRVIVRVTWLNHWLNGANPFFQVSIRVLILNEINY